MQMHTYKMIKSEIAGLHQYHSQHRVHVMNLLDEGKSHMKSIVDVIEENIRQFEVSRVQSLRPPQGDEKLEEYEFRDVHMATDAGSDLLSKVCSLQAYAVCCLLGFFSVCVVYSGYILCINFALPLCVCVFLFI